MAVRVIRRPHFVSAVRLPLASRQLGVDAVVAIAAVLTVGWLTLLTPAFTDFEAEAEPALTAIAAGDWAGALHQLPIYATATLLLGPFARAAHLLGGGDVAVFRAVAVPGALLMVGYAVLAAGWLREAGRPRIEQLGAVLLIAAGSPLAHGWQVGHPEEALVAGLAVGAVLLASRADTAAAACAAGALAGLAGGAKLWALVLVPAAVVAAPELRRQLQVAAAAVAGAAIAVAPAVLSIRDQFASFAAGAGGGGVFSQGNLWWFLGTPNPSWAGNDARVVQLHTAGNSPRLAPELVSTHAHELIVIGTAMLAAAWWWRMRDITSASTRTEASLWLAAAVLWWRAVPDPWFQPYYLLGAMTALVLAGARGGRLPAPAIVAWVTFWLVSVQNGPGMDLAPDVRSAIMLAVTVPTGVWLAARALQPPR